ncbi:TetR/AcrR family transcriptional regulator [Nocardia sp. NPDC004168]|uniref:TetR/AcrR family transcriptional regulator n=1 Tax=Nocardia sp. NPDC004168 TaxID=3154452 RepID=UPI0033AEAB77
MASTMRVRRSRSDRRRVLDAATELFLDGGLQQTTIDMVADRAGFPRKTVQRLYPIKRLLATDVAEDMCHRAVDRVRRHQPRDIDHLIDTLAIWTYVGTTRTGWVRLYNEVATVDHPYAIDTSERRERLREALSELLTNVTSCHPSRAEATADFLLTVAIGLAAQKVDSTDLQLATIRRQIGIVLRGARGT